MRNRWVRCAGERNRAEDVKKYFNTFASNNRDYIFIVAKKFNDLYDVCITYQQCCDIKRHLEREFGLTGYLDEAHFQEVSQKDCTRRSFSNTREFREFREHTLSTMNRPVIREKHAEARQHYNKVKNGFTTNRNRSRAFQILCFDIEVYEHNHDIMLEIGYVVCRFSPVTALRFPSQRNKPDVMLVTKRHLIIRDNLHYKNGDRVPDNRHGFRFGSSETLSMTDAVRRLIYL